MPPQSDETLPSEQSETLKQPLPVYNPDIFNIQKYLLILIFIQWFVCIISFVGGFYSLMTENTADISSGLEALIPLLIFSIYYSSGLLVTYKCHRNGLLIFAWVGVIVFIVLFLFIGYLILVILALAVGFGSINQAYGSLSMVGFILAVMGVVVIMTLKYAFNLATAVKRNEYSAA